MKSIVAQAAIAAMRPLDRQLSRLTNFELNWMRTQSVYYSANRPLTTDETMATVVHIANHLGIAPPRICATKRVNPYCMPWGKFKSIYLAPAHRQPYLIAHEVAHAATGTTGHPTAFLNRYIDALESIGGYRPSLLKRMRAFGINV